ncbi:hypothetical protein [Desulfosporosinus sp. BG]|uniref:hypothetical protein n=1 Tax=Desulfosporosinus sp. BG TaxID=1633135 RepID=UPI00083AFFE3|nr:hypothetical protein [Desulfosporosinus sp. BG]ODA39985.1 hypothetical protein DSBG_3276 [Desulfosporosinus sp. BG]
MSRAEKFLERIVKIPMPNDITFDEMSRFLLSIKCTLRKKGSTRHRQFKYPNYPEIITLMDGENLLIFVGIIREE